MKDRARTAKDIITERLAAHAVAGDISYPPYSHPHTGLGDLRLFFKNVLESVGGECHFVADEAEAASLLAASGLLGLPGQICSYVGRSHLAISTPRTKPMSGSAATFA